MGNFVKPNNVNGYFISPTKVRSISIENLYKLINSGCVTIVKLNKMMLENSKYCLKVRLDSEEYVTEYDDYYDYASSNSEPVIHDDILNQITSVDYSIEDCLNEWSKYEDRLEQITDKFKFKIVNNVSVKSLSKYFHLEIQKDYSKVSKTLSYLLRHNPYKANLDMDARGFVNINQLLKNMKKCKLGNITKEELEYIVNTDSKGRYQILDDNIRCVQGHSISGIEPDLELLTKENCPDRLWHGTSESNYKKICSSGRISKMSRNFVHLSEDPNTAKSVGLRHDKNNCTIICIRTEYLFKAGLKIYKSINGVYLVDSVPTNCFGIVETFRNKEND